MLKGISPVISPELLKALAEMGHGDELVIADGNFPCHSVGKDAIVIRADGHGVPEMLEAILKLMPLDTYAKPLYIIKKIPGDTVETPIWDVFDKIVKEHTNEKIEQIDRFDFYERAKKAYAVVMTGETALYGCIILKKGVIKE
jgi:L-fucose mutarotase